MKISKVMKMPLSEVNKLPRFDVNKLVKKQNRLLMPLAWLLSFPETIKRKVVIKKEGMEELDKVPYILLCNHNAFYDFKVATRAVFPRRATYIVAVDGFINREGIMRSVGCFGKRKFINDMGLVKQIKRAVVDLKHICMIYPEARYSHVGTGSVLPDSLGKLIKLLKVPVVTLICHGNHLSQPVWNLKMRKVNTTADMKYLITKQETISLTVDEINKRINEAFVYDDYAWQKENNVLIKEKFRAEGLQAVLYKCPHCLSEGKMVTKESALTCSNCNENYELMENGSLINRKGATKFDHIPSWYEWQREEVRKEIISGKYKFSHRVQINSLPNSTGFYEIGEGMLTHDLDGFKVSGEGFGEYFTFVKTPRENYSVHVEYNYFGRGHGISFSEGNDTYYMFSKDPTYLVTKVSFAVEELYKIKHGQLQSKL